MVVSLFCYKFVNDEVFSHFWEITNDEGFSEFVYLLSRLRSIINVSSNSLEFSEYFCEEAWLCVDPQH